MFISEFSRDCRLTSIKVRRRCMFTYNDSGPWSDIPGEYSSDDFRFRECVDLMERGLRYVYDVF